MTPPQKTIKHHRPIPISIASVLFWIGGVVYIFSAITIFISANIPSVMDFLASLGFGLTYSFLLYYCLFAAIFGTILIIAGYGLWNIKIYGAIAGFVGIGLGIISCIFDIMIWGRIIAILDISTFLILILLIILIILGWKSLLK